MRSQEAVRVIVEAIMFDADDRSLMDGVDDDIRQEIREAWTALVAETIQQIQEES